MPKNICQRPIEELRGMGLQAMQLRETDAHENELEEGIPEGL